MIDWVRITERTKHPGPVKHTLSLSTRRAKEPLCLRLLQVQERDTVRMQLQHLLHPPYTFAPLVDTFCDIWIDPFEFDCAQYGLDSLPAPLTVLVEWESADGSSSLWTPKDTPADNDWVVLCSSQPLPEKPKPAPLSTLADYAQDVAQSQSISQLQAALLILFINMFAVTLLHPERLVQQKQRPVVVQEDTAKPQEPGVHRTQLSIAPLVFQCVARYWPSFKESRLTSWISTVANAVLREINDREGADIPEDFDFIELISCWYPAQPWTKPAEPLCECIGSFHALLDSFLRQECARADWRDSVFVSAVAMALPKTSVCIPNPCSIDFPHPWTYGTVCRNAMYGWIYLNLGTDFTKWFERWNLNQTQVKHILSLMTGVMFLFTDTNVELFAKRFITTMIKDVME